MSKDSSSEAPKPAAKTEPAGLNITWHPLVAVLFVVVLYFVSQLFGGIVVSIYAAMQHWDAARATKWLNSSIPAQFSYVLLAETVAMSGIYWFLRHFKTSWAAIGLKRPKWRDVAYGVAAAPVYYVFYLGTVLFIKLLVPSLDVNQQQQLGFNDVHGALALSLTFVSLVVLPPLTEEIMIRGFLYTSLKKAMPILSAALLTSVIFAAAHLPEGGSGGLLYIAGIDTFVLSLMLIYLRERTGSLWASITLHAAKNGVAFLALFVFHLV